MADGSMAPPAAKLRTNADFRKLLTTPRSERVPDMAAQARAQQREQSKQQQPKERKPRPPRPSKGPGGAKQEEDKADADEPLYRDRAEERRKGVNPDYERTALSGLPAQGSIDAGISVEESKYLGGDLEHTHLVKGLDYALLQKVKDEQGPDKKAEDKPKAKAPVKKEPMHFATPLGQALWSVVVRQPKAVASELFLPRRSAFLYDLEGHGYGSELPTTLRRSKEDCPPPADAITVAADQSVLEGVSKLMAYMRVSSTKPGKKLKRRDKQRMLAGLAGGDAGMHVTGVDKLQAPRLTDNGSAQPIRQPEDEGDIFDDAGRDYVCDIPKKSKDATAAPSKPAKGYFGDQADAMTDLPPLPTERAGDDMEVEADGGRPPLPPADGPEAGPARPPAGYSAAGGYGYPDTAAAQQQWANNPDAVQAYVDANVAYQAHTDPEYQQLMAKQAELSGQGGALPGPPDGSAKAAMTKEQKEAGLASVFARDDKQKRRREADARERDPSFISDAYAECYPAFHEFGSVVEDDDADFNDMDRREPGKSRYDFDTEEQWQSYKNSKEAAPKAAFQFGLKRSDGRKAHKDLGKHQDGKINSQLNKIKGILEKDGKNYSKAFGGDGSNSRSLGGGGEDDSMPKQSGKKRRI